MWQGLLLLFECMVRLLLHCFDLSLMFNKVLVDNCVVCAVLCSFLLCIF